MSLQPHDRDRLGQTTQAATLDPASNPPQKVGGTTLAAATPAATSGSEFAPGGASAETASTLGDPALLAGATSGTLVAGLLPDDPGDLIRRYLQQGVDALADYIVRQVIQGLTGAVMQMLEEAARTVAGFPDALLGALERSMGLRRLTGAEINASQQVHGGALIDYSAVRVIPSSYFTKLSQMRAFVTCNVIHYPNDQLHLDTCCHELTHVAQYQAIGIRYIPEAIHAQHTGGYTYGNLATARQQGKTFRDFNREQQAQIAGDYYRVGVTGQAPSSSGSGSVGDYQHYIQQMRSGSYW